MRNLKKFLALVLAMMMVFGLMVTANAASSYTDADRISEDYAAAVEVIRRLGIMSGDDDGAFLPENGIRRAEYAKVLYYVATGDMEEKNPLLSVMADHGNFQDLDDPEIAWAKKYINFAAYMGWLKGYNSRTFGPKESLTVTQMLSVMLRVLGLDTGITGNWEMATLELAYKSGLTDNLDTLAGTASRQMVAQVAVDTLTRPEDEGTWKITQKDGPSKAKVAGLLSKTYNTEAEAIAAGAATGAEYLTDFDVVANTGETLGEQWFGLTKETKVDPATGIPSVIYDAAEWDDPVATEDESAYDTSVTTTVTDLTNTDKTKQHTVANLVKAANNNKDVNSTVIYLNGEKKDVDTVLGDEVTVYISTEKKDGKTVTTATVSIIRLTNAGQVTAAGTTKTGTDGKTYVTVGGIFEGKEAKYVEGWEVLAKGEVIMWYVDASNYYHFSGPLDVAFTGKLAKADITNNEYTISGQTKACKISGAVNKVPGLNSATTDPDFTNEYKFYTNGVGELVYAVKADGSSTPAATTVDYVVIDEIKGGNNGAMSTTRYVEANLVHLKDGKTEVVKVASVKLSSSAIYSVTVSNNTTSIFQSDDGNALKAAASTDVKQKVIFTCTLNSKGEAVLVKAELSTADNLTVGSTLGAATDGTTITKTSRTISGQSRSINVDDKTVFVVSKAPTGDTHQYVTYVGISNMPNITVTNTQSIHYVVEGKVATYVFIPEYGSTITNTSDDAFILNADPVNESKTADGTLYVYDVVINGERKTITATANNIITAVGLYTPTYDKETGYVEDATPGDIDAYGHSYGYTKTSGGLITGIRTDGTGASYVCADTAPVFKVTTGTDGKQVVTLDTAGKLTSDPNDDIYVVKKSDGSVSYFVIYVNGNGTEEV